MRPRFPVAPFAAAAAVALLAPRSHADATLAGGGGFVVRINDRGVLTGLPANGVHPDLGARITLGAGFHEWWGVDCMDGAQHVAGAACGEAPDWTRRLIVQPLTFVADGRHVAATTTLPDLKIVHDFSFEPITGKLVMLVTFENTGPNVISDLWYTREWRLPGTRGETWPPEDGAMLPPPPPDLWRVALMPNNLLPGATQGLTLTFDVDRKAPGSVDVPLQLWKSAQWPNGINFGQAFGICFADFDHDGWIDVFAAHSGNLWRNVKGLDWNYVADLDDAIGNHSYRYSAVLADYDDDQLLDVGTEPRNAGDNCMHLLHALGADQFDDIANDPALVDVQPCQSDSETICVADTDGDGWLDWFLPTYPDWMGSPGNWFLHNIGPSAATRAYRFHEASAEAGLDNPTSVNRPEGAEFCDVDQDGDLDLYSNGTLYRNIVTQVGTPLFEAMSESGSGIVFSDVLDEGCGFLDYDLDGDLDLLVSFCDGRFGVRMFESRGDGTFFVTPKSVFDSFNAGLCFGLSFEDWDNDGDIDVSSTEILRRNQFVEEGARHFTVATSNIAPDKLANATPAWGDFDHDGDMDAAIGTTGAGYLFENTSWDRTTPMDQRRYVRVRPVRDDAAHDDGLENEFGAQVRVDALGASDDGYQRVKVVTAAGGYLNQPEYAVRFALPADPDPADPTSDLEFAVTVDFKNPAGLGFTRVDRHVNPVLGRVALATLADREIVVYRSGRVRLNGCDFFPGAPLQPLQTTTDGLAQAGLATLLPAPVPAPATDWFVGIELATDPNGAPQRIEELIVDGQLGTGYDCGNGELANLFAWDVTDPAHPALLGGGAAFRDTKRRNDRSYFPFDVTLQPGRIYRLVAHMNELRDRAIPGPFATGPVTTDGGLSFQDLAPCSGAGAASAALDPSRVYLAVRFRAEPAGAWADAGHALAGTRGAPVLTGSGDLRGGSPTTVDLANGPLAAPLWFVIGSASQCIAFADGVIVPSLDVIWGGLATDANGAASLTGTWPDGVAGGTPFWFQAFALDAGASGGFAISNAVAGTTPY